jgi:hypothetical protein
MTDIRFACPQCRQRLACEPPSLGTQILCPACKKPILVPTAEIMECYRLFDLRPGLPLTEVKQAHVEGVKAWQPDNFPNDPEAQARAAEKTRELNQALARITAYLTGKLAEPRPAAKPVREEPKPAQESKPAPAPQAEKRPAPKAASAPSRAANAYDHLPKQRSALPWVLLGGVAVIACIALLIVFALPLLSPKGPALKHESTGAAWVKATPKAKQEYSRVILVEMEQKGVSRKLGLRINDAFFLEGLETLLGQKKPEDLDSSLFDLCSRLMNEAAPGRGTQ